MRAQLALLVAVIGAGFTAAQNNVTLTFDKESPRVVFISPEWPKALPNQPELQSSTSLPVSLGSAKPEDYLVVWDRDTNNVAIRFVKGLKDAWKVDPSDYRYIGYVTVRVEHEGKPLVAAQVELETKSRKVSNLIDPKSKGEARFFAVEPGEIKVNVQYKAAGKSLTTKQGFESLLSRSQLEPTFVVSVQEEADTAAPEIPKAATADPKAPSRGPDAAPADGSTNSPKGGSTGRASSFPGAIVTVLLGLILAIGGGFLLLQWINKNPGKLQDLGVAVPDGPPAPLGAQPSSAPVPNAPSEPQPVKQILLTDSAPTAVAAVPMAPAGLSSPRLVGEDGKTLDLHQGETTVGREAGLPLSLSSESTVSKRHAQLNYDGDRVVLRDLGSTNGTYVNGMRLQSETVLRVGDVVQFGSVRFRFEA